MEKRNSYILKVALFATGLSGIVAEYILATLASYFLGDSVRQWTLIISLMLFCMGLGSRITQSINHRLFEWFVGIEFALSIIVSFSALLTYSVAAISDYCGILIYSLTIITGLFIGMELPLAIRLNDQFEELKVNVAAILEKDYYGSLLGGLFFAFVGLPYLGLTYTPFLLGLINLAVAVALLYFFPYPLKKQVKRWLGFLALGTAFIIFTGLFSAEKVILYGEQKKYLDKVVYSEQSRYQKIVLTQWEDDHWLYLDGHLQLSSYDEALYHEVLVHPAMQLTAGPQEVLILGGGDGCAARELFKYDRLSKITLVDLDPSMTRLASEHPVLTQLNEGALSDPRLAIHNTDGFHFLEKESALYDLIIIDLPDPRSVELSRLYSMEFYALCRQRLRPQGVIITQAGSPYFAPASFACIQKTIAAAGFSVIPLHNQVVTMGEWGWILGTKDDHSPQQLIEQLTRPRIDSIDTRWYNPDAARLITSFGKDFFIQKQRDSIQVNRIHNPVVYHYFLKGKWGVY